eukprot:Tbor_TRINITY_DN420_c0_g1::TRINITY_DN420_c0_g1_i1::g.3135::m.3135
MRSIVGRTLPASSYSRGTSRSILYLTFGSGTEVKRQYTSLTRTSIPPHMPRDIEEHCMKISADIQNKTLTAKEFREIVQKRFPTRSYTSANVYTVRQLAESFPYIFKVTPDETTGWYTVSNVSPQTSDAGDNTEVADAIRNALQKFLYSSSSSAQSAPGTKTVAKSVKDVIPASILQSVKSRDLLDIIRAQGSVDVVTRVRVRPKATPRGAHVFIDGDSITRDQVTSLMQTLKLQTVSSTKVVARQPSTPQHTNSDVICSYQTQTFQVLESQIEHLKLGSTVILKEVVVMCSEKTKSIYVEMGRRLGFSVNFFVVTPSSVGVL